MAKLLLLLFFFFFLYMEQFVTIITIYLKYVFLTLNHWYEPIKYITFSACKNCNIWITIRFRRLIEIL